MLISESPQFLKVAMERNLSIITGGTGKTTVLKAIIEVYCILHPRNRIVLAAPTGKTSRCMTQSSGIIARMSSLSSISEAAAITTRTG
jgi:exodeoxyribonuclease V alpha subunit